VTLPWIRRAPGVPYFETDAGEPWTPIGQNDALPWPELRGVLQGDLAPVARHLAWLRESGVTCLRLMLEYAERDECYFEAPDGTWNEQLVAAWDALVPLCERSGIRLLLTPFDTYFNWVRFDAHPYNAANGGPCPDRTQFLINPETRARIKRRLEFAARRWSGSGAVFAWDIWNEMHPVQGGDVPGCFEDFIGDVAPFLRDVERAAHGRAHPQCASVFGPELDWKPWLREPIFRHPKLDFASTHLYAEGSIDDPADTVAPALAVGRLMADALGEITDQRPLFDSEHGPIHTFKDRGITLPEAFDDEYFRHTAWAHLASGGAGGGMRWPNRAPHVLTPGMRRLQRAMAGFLPLMDWQRFGRQCLNDALRVDGEGVAALGCGDADQAVLYLLRTGPLLEDGRVTPRPGGPARVHVPGLGAGPFRAILWDTSEGQVMGEGRVQRTNEGTAVEVPRFGTDVAVAVRRAA
jgi:hypothetical protein